MSVTSRVLAVTVGVGLLAVAGVASCSGEPGAQGQTGSQGEPGTTGAQGPQGPAGPGTSGQPGPGALTRDPNVESGTPLSSMVAFTFRNDFGLGTADLGDYLRKRVDQVAKGTLPPDVVFPVPAAATDSIRTVPGVYSTVIVKWLDALSFDDQDGVPGFDPKAVPRFGANTDYIAYFGDGWDTDGNPPQWHGKGSAGWVWTNHEYISNNRPRSTAAPTGQHMVLAKFLRSLGLLTNDVSSSVWDPTSLTTYGQYWKKQVGGSWFRIVQDPATGEWTVDRSAPAKKYDATSKMLTKVVGRTLGGLDHDDSGAALPPGVAVGTHNNCAGGQSPWGTVLTGEENTQNSYGDLEPAWDGNQNFVAGQGFDPGANVTFPYAASTSSEFGGSPDPNARHNRDVYSYVTEVDVGAATDEYYGKTTSGVGHRKIGGMGRARWESGTFAVDQSWKLRDGQPVVIYGGDDRRGGRVYKFVSSANYTAGMTRAQIRGLLDSGRVYAAHFAGLDNEKGDELLGGVVPTQAAPGNGRWVELSVSSMDVAPNAAAVGAPGTKVGDALKDVNYNGIGGFPTDDDVLAALFTVSNKVGIMELNRPEDLEWNPRDPSGTPTLYIAFTEHGSLTALDQEGRRIGTPGAGTARNRTAEKYGSIFGLREANPTNPGSSSTFTFFRAWKGRKTPTGEDGLYDASKPDNLAIDRSGGVWFGTDGNFGNNGKADAVYYLDLDPARASGVPNPTFGKAFRVLSVPSDAEATGPTFGPDMKTLFLSVQHPGEDVFSYWP